MAITFVQHVSGFANSAASDTVVSCTGVGAGSTLVVLTATANTDRTFTVTSDVDGAFTDGPAERVAATSYRYIRAYTLRVTTAGTHSVTINQTSTYVQYAYKVIEVTGCAATTTTSTNQQENSQDPYYCAGASGLAVAAGDAVIAAAVLLAARTPHTPTDANYTTESTSGGSAYAVVFYQVFAGAAAAERCQFAATSDQVTDDVAGLMIVFSPLGTGTGLTWATNIGELQVGGSTF